MAVDQAWGIPALPRGHDDQVSVALQGGQRHTGGADQVIQGAVGGGVHNLRAQLGQAACRAVRQYAAADSGAALEHDDRVAEPIHLAGTRQSGNPRTDDHDLRALHSRDPSGWRP